ncbi:MAG: rod shape-determining protein RodA [Saprospiraceae bacterium]|nr:rod shape-determining protein RodA [Saprospiraceae bacterium]
MRPTKSKHDWIALALFVSLVIVGWLMIYAAGYNQQPDARLLSLSAPAGKQLLFIGVAAVLFVLVNIVDTKFWRTFAYPLYVLSLVMLVLVLLLGHTVKGSTSWFAIGAFSFQPAEFAKFSTCLALAGFLSYYRTDLKRLRYQLGALGLMGLPAMLIMVQPDAGSALVFSSFLLLLYREGMPTVLYIAGACLIALVISALLFPILHLVAVILLLAAALLSLQLKDQLLWGFGLVGLAIAEVVFLPAPMPWPVLLFNGLLLVIAVARRIMARYPRHVVVAIPAVVIGIGLVFLVHHAFTRILEPHQQDRINVWLHPEQCDPQGSLYNVLQSKIAIGSGGVMGKGFLKGTMTNLNYVPEQTTDFIFSTIGEEQGFVGSAGVIILYTFLLLRIVSMAERMRSAFSRHYAYGLLGILFFHFFINIGMTMGIVPIIGIPLPFVSYGGSSLIVFSLMFGVLFKMDRERYGL